ncbi:hypothetical protein ACTZT6_25670, partial [Klebsiella pneumoniae]
EWVHVQLHQQKGMISLSPPTICNSADFHALEKQLEQKETWEQVVGVTCFGGATWQLRAGSV